MLRSILAVFLGLVLSNVAIFGFEHVVHAVYPPPAGLDHSDPGALHAALGKMPTGAFLLLLLAWVIGTSIGAYLAATIARRARIGHGLVVGGLIMIGAILIMLHIPHPAWLWALALASIPAAAYAGAWFASRGKAMGPGSISPATS